MRANLESDIPIALYNYYKQYPGAPQMPLQELSEAVQVSLSDEKLFLKFLTQLTLLEKKKFIKPNLFNDGKGGTVEITPEGIIAVKDRLRVIASETRNRIFEPEKSIEKKVTVTFNRSNHVESYLPSLEALLQKNPEYTQHVQIVSLMEQIKEYFVKTSAPKHVLIHGQPQVGKTTILRDFLPKVLGTDYVPLLIDLQALPTDNLDEFTFELARQLTVEYRDWAKNNHLTLSLTNPNMGSFQEGRGKRGFYEQWERLKEDVQKKQKHVVVMFDEIENLAGSPQEKKLNDNIIDFVYSFVTGRENGFFILSGSDRAKYPYNPKIRKLLLKRGIEVRVDYYHERIAESVFSLIQNYFTFAESLSRYFKVLFDGYPCFLPTFYEAIIDFMWEHPGKRQLDEYDIEPLCDKTINYAALQLWNLSQCLTPNECAVTWLISQILDEEMHELEFSSNTLSPLADQYDLTHKVDISDGIYRLEDRQWIEWQDRRKERFRLKLCIVPLWLRHKPIIFNRNTCKFERHLQNIW